MSKLLLDNSLSSLQIGIGLNKLTTIYRIPKDVVVISYLLNFFTGDANNTASIFI